MNKMMGFLGSYLVGLLPSSTPPCGVARTAADADAETEAAFVTVLVTTDAIEDIFAVFRCSLAVSHNVVMGFGESLDVRQVDYIDRQGIS